MILHLDIPWFFVNLRRQTATKLETEGEMESDMESDMEEKGKGVLITQGWQDLDTLDLTNASQQNMAVFSCTATPPFRKSILYPLHLAKPSGCIPIANGKSYRDNEMAYPDYFQLSSQIIIINHIQLS